MIRAWHIKDCYGTHEQITTDSAYAGHFTANDAYTVTELRPVQPELTDDDFCQIAQETQTAEPGRDGYIMPVAFGRAVERRVRGEG